MHGHQTLFLLRVKGVASYRETTIMHRHNLVLVGPLSRSYVYPDCKYNHFFY
jgi:hypothetical protein